MRLRIIGSPVGPKTLLFTAVSVCVLLAASTIRSAPRPAVHPPTGVVVLAEERLSPVYRLGWRQFW
jgi:hypothetical protein